MFYMENFRIIKTINSSEFKKVYLLEEKVPPYNNYIGKVVAPGNDDLSLRLLREFDILESLYDTLPDAIHFLSTPVMCGEEKETGEIFAIYKQISGESVADLLSRRAYLNEVLEDNEVIQFSKEALSCLLRLHSRGILHLDLSPANIIMKNDGGVAFIDFEEAIVIAVDIHQIKKPRGTSGYMAPELVARNEVSKTTDVYSLGKVIQELFSLNRNRISKKIKFLSPLCDEMTSFNPAIRPNIFAALERFDRQEFDKKGVVFKFNFWFIQKPLIACVMAGIVLLVVFNVPTTQRIKDSVHVKIAAVKKNKERNSEKIIEKNKITKTVQNNTKYKNISSEIITSMPRLEITTKVEKLKKLDVRSDHLKKKFENYDKHFKFWHVSNNTYYFVSKFKILDRMNCDWMSANIMRIIGNRALNIIILPNGSRVVSHGINANPTFVKPLGSNACQIVVGTDEDNVFEINLLANGGSKR